MGVFHVLKATFVEEDRDRVIYECRHCGTTLPSASHRCPNCKRVAVERFDVT